MRSDQVGPNPPKCGVISASPGLSSNDDPRDVMSRSSGNAIQFMRAIHNSTVLEVKTDADFAVYCLMSQIAKEFKDIT